MTSQRELSKEEIDEYERGLQWDLTQEHLKDCAQEHLNVIFTLRAREQSLAEAKKEVASASEAVLSLLTGVRMKNGEYPHLITCSGDRRFPAGVSGHSCSCNPPLRFALAEAEKEVERLIKQEEKDVDEIGGLNAKLSRLTQEKEEMEKKLAALSEQAKQMPTEEERIFIDNVQVVASWLTNDFSNRALDKQKRMGEFLHRSISQFREFRSRLSEGEKK